MERSGRNAVPTQVAGKLSLKVRSPSPCGSGISGGIGGNIDVDGGVEYPAAVVELADQFEHGSDLRRHAGFEHRLAVGHHLDRLGKIDHFRMKVDPHAAGELRRDLDPVVAQVFRPNSLRRFVWRRALRLRVEAEPMEGRLLDWPIGVPGVLLVPPGPVAGSGLSQTTLMPPTPYTRERYRFRGWDMKNWPILGISSLKISCPPCFSTTFQSQWCSVSQARLILSKPLMPYSSPFALVPKVP